MLATGALPAGFSFSVCLFLGWVQGGGGASAGTCDSVLDTAAADFSLSGGRSGSNGQAEALLLRWASKTQELASVKSMCDELDPVRFQLLTSRVER